MKRLRIYLDTSVISHLDAPDAMEKQEDTRKLWEAIEAGKYESYISPVVMAELDGCTEPKYSILLGWLGSVAYTVLPKTNEVLELAARYLDARILREKSFDDCQHIAYACVHNCDMLVSWNFKHLVNLKTISGVKGVNALTGYKEMPIYTPTILISGGADDDT
ncbi:MAG: type II toxin-antitoxin system VapC family toxin [Clostridia bacterium]|nr:type II toxin-antitoxin system VapC family toxin [Clostridia bacterium]